MSSPQPKVTFEQLKQDPEIRAYIQKADETLFAIGYTEHSFAHVVKCAETAADILTHLSFDERTVELAKIAGYLHDIGNVINRKEHAQSGALMAFHLLSERGMDPAEVAIVVNAIGNHDESASTPTSPVAAALVLADKTDVRRSRVRHTPVAFDIHDRVNYAVTEASLTLQDNKVHLKIELDDNLCPVADYFRIFMDRMNLCQVAAASLGQTFVLTVNGLKFF